MLEKLPILDPTQEKLTYIFTFVAENVLSSIPKSSNIRYAKYAKAFQNHVLPLLNPNTMKTVEQEILGLASLSLNPVQTEILNSLSQNGIDILIKKVSGNAKTPVSKPENCSGFFKVYYHEAFNFKNYAASGYIIEERLSGYKALRIKNLLTIFCAKLSDFANRSQLKTLIFPSEANNNHGDMISLLRKKCYGRKYSNDFQSYSDYQRANLQNYANLQVLNYFIVLTLNINANKEIDAKLDDNFLLKCVSNVVIPNELIFEIDKTLNKRDYRNLLSVNSIFKHVKELWIEDTATTLGLKPNLLSAP